MKKKRELQQKLEALIAEEAQQLERLKDEGLAGDEEREYDARRERIEELTAEIQKLEEAEQKIRDAEARAAQTARLGNQRREPAQVEDNAAKKPWESLGEQLQAIAFASSPHGAFNGLGGRIDPRLHQRLAPSGASAQVPADGAVFIQKQFTDALMQRMNDASSLLGRCDQIPVSEGNDGIEAPYVDETSRATGSRWGGVQVYRAAETDAVTAKRPQFNKFKLDLLEMKGLAYASERILRNVASLESIFQAAFSEEFAWKIDNEILFGNGASEMLGIMSSANAALVSVTKETGQAAATVVWENVVKMRARVHPRSRANMVWLVNVDVEPALQQMSFQAGTAAVPVYLPAGGATATPFATLFGRPVIPVEQCQTLGTTGDIIAADLSQYLVINQGGLRSATSVHVRFIYDEMTF